VVEYLKVFDHAGFLRARSHPATIFAWQSTVESERLAVLLYQFGK
jgi:hypothetical protein